LREVGVGHITTECLSKILSSNESISHLDLSKNKLGVKGFKALIPGLLKNKSIMNINLGCNDIFGEEASE
jgi:hypothetical protein